MSVSPNQSALYAAIYSFLTAILPSSVEIVKGQENRVPEPSGTDYVVMTDVMRGRLSTNVDSDADVKFVGSIAAGVMTVSSVALGLIASGATVFGLGVAAGTVIGQQLSGPAGGTGTYAVSPFQTVASTTLAAGAKQLLAPTEITVQLDVHGQASADNAQTIATLFRDDYATDFFFDNGAVAAPLYAEDPRQVPFVNENQQIENRWVVAAHFQVNAVATVPQQYADAAKVTLISVDASYPG